MLWILEKDFFFRLTNKIIVKPARFPTSNIIFERIKPSATMTVFIIDEFYLYDLVLGDGRATGRSNVKASLKSSL